MPIPCNKLTLSVVTPANGIIVNPGFHTEYSGRDWDSFESRFLPVLTAEDIFKLKKEEQTALRELQTKIKENLWVEKKSGAVILKPNIEPVDMTIAPGTDKNRIDCFLDYSDPNLKYRAYGGDWENLVITGNPKAQVLFQKNVQVKVGDKYIAQPWRIVSDPTFRENQGVTLWMGKNTLPENEEDAFTLCLEDPSKNNGIYIEIKSGKALRMAHYIDVANTTPGKGEWNAAVHQGRKEKAVQWTVEDLPAPKGVYAWPEPYSVYTLFIVGRWIFFGINGLEQTIAMECQNYELDADGNPIVLRDKATLYLDGKGQVGLGFKKMVYAETGRLETPLEFPGYKLTNANGIPEIEASSYAKPADTDIRLEGLVGGAIKAGGNVQTGVLGDTNASYGVYGSVELSGKALNTNPLLDYTRSEFIEIETKLPKMKPGDPERTEKKNMLFHIDFDGFGRAAFAEYGYSMIVDTLSETQRTTRTRQAYLARVSEATPVLFRFKVSDKQTRETATITSPTPPASGDCLHFNYSWNVDADGSFSGAISNLGIMSQEGATYHDWLAAYEPDVDITLRHRGAASGLKILRHTMTNIGFLQEGVNQFSLEMQGYDLVRLLSEEPMKETRSYDDKNWTYAELMAELCNLFGVTLHIAAGVGAGLLPKSSDASSPLWTFTPGTNKWDALNRIRKGWGGILYPDDNNEAWWKARPTSASGVDYIFTRGTAIIQNPKIEVRGGWKTRIFIIGKAGQTLVGEYQKDDKLVGAWYQKTLEGKIGRSKEYVEINDSLADWDSVKKRGDEIFLMTTGPGTYLTGKVPEVLIGAQDCRKILPWQVVQWKDDLVTAYNDKKFAFISLAGKNDKFTAEAEFEAKML